MKDFKWTATWVDRAGNDQTLKVAPGEDDAAFLRRVMRETGEGYEVTMHFPVSAQLNRALTEAAVPMVATMGTDDGGVVSITGALHFAIDPEASARAGDIARGVMAQIAPTYMEGDDHGIRNAVERVLRQRAVFFQPHTANTANATTRTITTPHPIGSTVQLRSGGPAMTVGAHDEWRCWCFWFVGGFCMERAFRTEALLLLA